MDTRTMIKELERVEEKHKHDKLFTGQLNVAEMAHDVRKRLEELKPYEDTGFTPEQIREIDRLYAEKCQEVAELRQRDTAILPENIQGNKKDNGRLLFGTCPKCKTRVSNVEGGNYCQNCRQRLKWEEKLKTPEEQQEWKERMLRNFMRKSER